MSHHPPDQFWRVSTTRTLSLASPKVLGILNVTPDSFSDGGDLPDPAAVVRRAGEMLAAGAAGLDIGGESTRPGASRVLGAAQIDRVVPAITAVRRAFGPEPIITIDTTLSAVALAALDAGADAVNDVSAGQESADMFALCAQRRCGIILMHRAKPPEMDHFSTAYGRAGIPAAPAYSDVVHDVGLMLASRAIAAIDAGVPQESIVLDPGLGFGKSVADNLALIERTAELAELGYPILSGISRKSFVGAFMGLPAGHQPRDRVSGSVTLARRHIAAGARLLRVHDVAEHIAAIRR